MTEISKNTVLFVSDCCADSVQLTVRVDDIISSLV